MSNPTTASTSTNASANTNQLTNQSTSGTTASQSAPWAPAQPYLQQILSGAQSYGVDALPNYAGTANALGTGLAQYGAAGWDRSKMLNNAYNTYQGNLAPYLDPSYTDPTKVPGIQAALNTIQQDVSNNVNGMFAGAGRDLSGMNTQTLARGISQGEAGLLLNEYNQLAQNQLGAANSLFGAGNTTGKDLSNMSQVGMADQLAGLQALGAPANYLTQLAGIGTPIASLGQSNTGNVTGNLTGNTQGTVFTNQQGSSTPSLLQDVTSIFGGNTVGNIGKTAGGLFSLFA